ncbi:putative transcriptional regulator [Tessaracoccus bendigoensis DSM 12906]|uniref:Putative transcriptional regulator n=1 Tax=Tessaracoccus bendigoensis DSM 12906 TaxID=1123357 RepID=A0A1M6AH06_9ACTN|nr:YqgE/AlgH family protein [Tessaracoccus bendigoensis]SHI35707.1 putative transcriptional regulator [Tessaracoccus bendigoensis DSM 12906]
MDHAGAVSVGQLLVATQPGRGGYFDRSVVLLIEHQAQATVGLCLNVMSEIPVHNVLSDFTELMSPPVGVFEGGPVNEDVVVALGEPGSPDSPPPGWERISGDIGVVDVNFPSELLATSFTQLRVFVGLSAWAPGQLESELIRGSWFRTGARAEDVFGDPGGLWRRVLRRMGGTTGRWSTWTDQPSNN